MANVIEKPPTASKLYNFDFTDDLATGETVSSATSVTSDTPTGATALTIGTPTVSSPNVQVRISGGSAGYTYHLTCTVSTSDSNTLVGCGDLRVVAC